MADHACWNDEESARKVKKHRFGGVRCAEVRRGLAGGMMERHEAEARNGCLTRFASGRRGEEEEEEEAAATDGAAGGEKLMAIGDETERDGARAEWASRGMGAIIV